MKSYIASAAYMLIQTLNVLNRSIFCTIAPIFILAWLTALHQSFYIMDLLDLAPSIPYSKNALKVCESKLKIKMHMLKSCIKQAHFILPELIKSILLLAAA